MASVVVGTAGHIDHGKTALLRALTGIDADRLPEERARGMTIDVGYAHLALPDGSELDFVDVPGHDRLVGNMLVGAGEIDAALLVVAADDGPRAQTLEHLAILDALEIADAVVAITKADLADAARLAEVRDAVAAVLAPTTLRGASLLDVSARSGEGLPALREALVRLRDRVAARRAMRPSGPPRLAIDRVFAAKGRGGIVTGTLRGGAIRVGDRLRLVPGEAELRVREVQVHGAVHPGHDGGRTALALATGDAPDGALRRGAVLTTGPAVETTDRILVAVRAAAPVPLGERLRLHLGTDQSGAVAGAWGRGGDALPDGRRMALLRLDAPVGATAGDRAVLRRPSPGEVVAGVVVLDPRPPRGVARRRATPERLAALAIAVDEADGTAALDAMIALHGALSAVRADAIRAAFADGGVAPSTGGSGGPGVLLAPDIVAALEAVAATAVAGHHTAAPSSPGLPLAELRPALLRELRRLATVDRSAEIAALGAVDRVVADLVARGRLAREGDRVRDARRAAGPPPELLAAMGRLEAALSVTTPPALAEAARAGSCPPEGIRALEAAGRIVRVEADLAWAAPTYQRLAAVALAMATRGPLTPAAYRDATGSSRRYVMAILDDLNRRGLLRRTEAGHVPGPKAPRTAGS
jgi:selenocysteine-specific elongation factor